MECPRCGLEVDELIQPVGELEDSCQPCSEPDEDEIDKGLASAGLTKADL